MDSFEFNKQHSFNEKGICTKCGMSKVFADAFGKNCNIVTDFNENSYATTNLTDQDQEKPNIDFYTILSSINNDLKNIITKMQCPNKLYHYTSLQGLMGIVKSNSLWLSEARFLNDSLEIEHGLDIIKANISQVSHDFPTKFSKDVLNNVNNKLSNRQYSYYIASFSEETDSLNQWRPYSNNGDGVCIVFNRDKNNYFEDLFKFENCNISLQKVIYFDEDKYTVIKNALLLQDINIDQILKKITPIAGSIIGGAAAAQVTSAVIGTLFGPLGTLLGYTLGAGAIYAISKNMNEAKKKSFIDELKLSGKVPESVLKFDLEQIVTQLISTFAPFFKDISFQYENEIRLVYTTAYKDNLNGNVNFRLNGNKLIPFVESNSLTRKGNDSIKLPIEEIKVGPCIKDNNTTIEGIRLLLDINGFNDCKITSSRSPLRH